MLWKKKPLYAKWMVNEGWIGLVFQNMKKGSHDLDNDKVNRSQ